MAALPQEKLDEFSPVIRKFQSLGIQLVPVKGKIPACGDGWQNSRLSESELIRHLMNGSSGLGVICGEISRGLVVVDYDCTDAFREADLRKRETGKLKIYPRLVALVESLTGLKSCIGFPKSFGHKFKRPR